jgi:hypothetical protein
MKKLTKKVLVKRAEKALVDVRERILNDYYDEDELMFNETTERKLAEFIADNK